MKKVPGFSLFLILVATLSIPFISSCSKSDRSKDTDLQSAKDMSLAYAIQNDINRQLNVFAGSQPELNAVPGPVVSNPCGGTAVTGAVFPKVDSISYGITDCTGPDGANRRGTLVATFTGNYRDSLTTITVSPRNYYFNGYKVAGVFTIKNMGMNWAGHPWFQEKAVSCYFNYPDGKLVTWTSTQTREMIQGWSTPVVFDDVYQLQGTASGTSSDGNYMNVYINTPLVFSMNCPWIESGTLYLVPINLGNRFINFGTGACDNTADLWIYGDKYKLYLD
jgi:hypothetical protein